MREWTSTDKALAAAGVVFLLLGIMALYGYMTGAWDAPITGE